MADAKTKFDWQSILLNLSHLALVGGAAYLAIAKPQYTPVLAPFMQMAGQILSPPTGQMTTLAA